MFTYWGGGLIQISTVNDLMLERIATAKNIWQEDPPFIWTIKYISFSKLSWLASSSGESTENRGHSSIFISCSPSPYQTSNESVWGVQWEEKLFSKHLEQGTDPIGSILTYVDTILLLRHLHLLPLSIMCVPQAKSSILELIMWLLEMQEWCN